MYEVSIEYRNRPKDEQLHYMALTGAALKSGMVHVANPKIGTGSGDAGFIFRNEQDAMRFMDQLLGLKYISQSKMVDLEDRLPR